MIKLGKHLQQNTLRSANEVMVKTLENTLGRMMTPPKTPPDMSAMISYWLVQLVDGPRLNDQICVLDMNLWV
jgi:hypothetical protein